MTWIELGLIAIGAGLTASTPFLVLYARRAAQGLAKIADVTLTDEQLRQVEQWVTLAIAFVDEQVRRRAKGLAATAQLDTAEDKRRLAIQTARELAPDDLRAFSDRALEIIIDAKVQDRRVSVTPPSASAPSLPPPSSRLLSDDPVTGRLKRPS